MRAKKNLENIGIIIILTNLKAKKVKPDVLLSILQQKT